MAERRISPTVTALPLRSAGFGTVLEATVTAGVVAGTLTGTAFGTLTGTALGMLTEGRLSSAQNHTVHPLGSTSDTRYPREGLAVGDPAVCAPRPGMLRQSRVLDFSSCALFLTPSRNGYTATPFFPLPSTLQPPSLRLRPVSGTLYNDIRRNTPSLFIVSRFSPASGASFALADPRLIIDMLSERVRDGAGEGTLALPDWISAFCCSNGDCIASANSPRLRAKPSSWPWEKATP